MDEFFEGEFGAVPDTAEEALENAAGTIKTAKKLLIEHKRNPQADRGRGLLRGAAELGWFAALSLCHVILLRRGVGANGSADDVDRARKHAKSHDEKTTVRIAEGALNVLHASCFYRGDCPVRRVEVYLEDIDEARHGLT